MVAKSYGPTAWQPTPDTPQLPLKVNKEDAAGLTSPVAFDREATPAT